MELNNQNGQFPAESGIATANTTTEITNNFSNIENLEALLEASSNLEDLQPVIQLTSEYIELAKPGET